MTHLELGYVKLENVKLLRQNLPNLRFLYCAIEGEPRLGCFSKLEGLTLHAMGNSNPWNLENLFRGCDSLKRLKLSAPSFQATSAGNVLPCLESLNVDFLKDIPLLYVPDLFSGCPLRELKLKIYGKTSLPSLVRYCPHLTSLSIEIAERCTPQFYYRDYDPEINTALFNSVVGLTELKKLHMNSTRRATGKVRFERLTKIIDDNENLSSLAISGFTADVTRPTLLDVTTDEPGLFFKFLKKQPLH